MDISRLLAFPVLSPPSPGSSNREETPQDNLTESDKRSICDASDISLDECLSEDSAMAVGRSYDPAPRSTADFPCPSCTKVFRTKQGWKSHQYLHTGNGERPRPFSCPFPGCGRTFTQSGNLKTHQNTHTGERPYICKFPGCTRAFGQGTNLRKHEASHLRDRPQRNRKQGASPTGSSAASSVVQNYGHDSKTNGGTRFHLHMPGEETAQET